MPIFNSLGSNYTYQFVWLALFAGNKETNRTKLTELLSKKYSGKAVLVYKGREALSLALRAINRPKEYTVGICGYTCYAVYEAVIKEGYTVEYLDIDEEKLHFSFETLRSAVQKNPKLKIVIVQNTLGYPCEMEKIAKFCKEKGIVLIEDLAHSIGTKYANGKEAGTMGDFIALSFSQDKMIDGISGGALIVRNFKYFGEAGSGASGQFSVKDKKDQVKDKQYPLFTFTIRKTYGIGLGKGIHLALKKLDLLSKPMNNLHAKTIYSLAPWYCGLVLHELRHLDANLLHRKKIAKIYADNINEKLLSEFICKNIDLSTNLRFPIFSDNRQILITYLKKYGIFVSDIWYDAPVAPKKYLHLTNYSAQCPHAEKVSSRMLNLPTHRNVSEKEAEYIAAKVNEWIQLESK